MDEEKKTIRAQIRRLRAQMTREEIGQRSQEIWQRVLGRLHFYEIRHFGQVKPGVMGILEPSEEEGARRAPDPDGAVLMIMPGVAFDRRRSRIGYGGGFYDRYLDLHPHLQTAAVAFDFQILDKVPAGEHDKRPDCIYTPSEVIR